MKRLVAAAMFVLFGALFACVSRADAVPPTTNDWFDASFTALTEDTVIAQGDTTGITRGAGSWTAVPTTGTAVIAADADAGGGATLLSLTAPGEELTFIPAALAATSGLETVSAEMKADAIDDLPALGADVQGAFTVYLDENDVLSAQGWTAAGWTNLAYAAVGSLTNAWFTLYLDFAKDGGVRKVRYSVKPAAGALAVLADANGTTWFQAGKNADVVSSVSFSGIGSVRAFSGDELEVQGVATYNGVAYQAFEEAIAAGVADGWANGNVVMLSDAEWFPTATGAYNVDVNGNTLTVKGASGSWSGTTYTVSKLYYIWTGGATGDWWTASNWTPSPSKWSNGDYVMFTNDVSVLYNNNTDRNNTYYYHYTYADGCTVTVSSKTGDGTYYRMVPNSMIAQNGGKWIFDNVNIAQRGANLVMDSSFGFAAGSSNIVYSGNNSKDVTISCDLVGDFVIEAQGGAAFNVRSDISLFTGKFISNETKANRGIVFGNGASDTSIVGSADASFVVNEGAYMYFNVANSVQFQIGELLGNGTICGDNRNASGESFRLYIGGKNTDFEANAAVIRVTANSKALDVSKVGTGAMTYNLNGVRDLYVDAGSVVITNTSRLPSGNIAFCGGRVAGSATLPLVDISAKVKNSTAAIDLDIAGSVTFATALADSNVGGLVKRGDGTLTLSAAPAYSGPTTVAGGVLVVPRDTVISELSCVGGKLTVPLADNDDETPVLTIASLAAGTTVEDLEEAVAVNGVAISVEAGEGGYIVKATRTAQTLTWTGAVDTNWTTPGNWSIGGVFTSLVPAESDTVVFPALAENAPAWQVTLSATPTVTNVTANGAVTLTGALIRTEKVEGTATITLGDGAGFRTYDYLNAVMTISASLEANGSAEHPNEIRGYYTTKGGKPDEGGTTVTFTGNLTGTGTLKIIGCRCTNELSGDYTAFSGHLWVVDDQVARNKTYLTSVNTTSSNAVWTVYNDNSDNKFLRLSSQTVYFGALNGSVYQSSSYYNNIFEIGAANVDCAFGGKLGATSQNHITKVGTATLTFAGSKLGNLEVRDGVFAVGAESAMPNTSITFTGSGFFDPVTNTVDFAAKLVNSTTAPIGLLITNDLTIGEIPASNTAGLTKKGAGTLTLSAAPKYTGWTTVEEGELIVPPDTVLNVCFASGTLTGARYGAVSFADGYKFTTGTDARIVASGAADVSNLVIYIADPTADDVYRVLRASGGVSGAPTLAFPEDTSDELKARWTLKIGSKSVSVGTHDIGSRLILK